MNKKNELLIKGTWIQIVSIHSCKYCADEYALYDLEKEVLDKHWFLYSNMCPTCRFRLLYSFLNDRYLYRRKDSETWASLISIRSEHVSGKVIDANTHKILKADDFGLKYGRDISDNIFQEFLNVIEDVPKSSRMIYPSLNNAEYCSHSWWSTNVYLSFCVFQDCEDVYHSFRVLGQCKNIFSCLDVQDGSSNLYLSRMINNSSEIAYSSNILDSSFLVFCTNMVNCNECMFCCNQANASYMIRNQQYSKEEYQQKKAEHMSTFGQNDRFAVLENQYKVFLDENLIESATNIQNCEWVTGDNMYYSSTCVNSYMWIGNKECVNTILTGNNDEDTMVRLINSIESWMHCENVVWSCSFGQWIYNLFFVIWATSSRNCYYSIDIDQCEECMFCVSLQNKKHCILNKQYSQEEYFYKKEEIINQLKEQGKRWSLIPRSFSDFPYNDTVSYQYFKIHKVISHDGSEQIIDLHGRWIVQLESDAFITDATMDLWWEEKICIKRRTKDKEINVPEGTQTIQSNELPSIWEAQESILQQAIICKQTWRPFRILKQELEYLQKKWFPLPLIHTEQRIQNMIDERPTFNMYARKSDLSGDEVLSVYNNNNTKIYSYTEYQSFMF